MVDTVAGVLAAARKRLTEADIENSALDARLLVQAAAQLTHEEIISEPKRILSETVCDQIFSFVDRRLSHEPISKILGVREFYGRSFMVTKDVLDPRPDTEAVIDLVLRNIDRARAIQILDLGSGSGAIGLTLLAELANSHCIAVDISQEALRITKLNAEALNVSERLVVRAGPWFASVETKFDLIVSNPPYIPSGVIEGLEEDVRDYDPHVALDGGVTGLDCFHTIAGGSLRCLVSDGIVAVEIGAGQSPDVISLFGSSGLDLFDQQVDLGGHVRALAFRRV
jgi:release factor glutamine methyltransferase